MVAESERGDDGRQWEAFGQSHLAGCFERPCTAHFVATTLVSMKASSGEVGPQPLERRYRWTEGCATIRCAVSFLAALGFLLAGLLAAPAEAQGESVVDVELAWPDVTAPASVGGYRVFREGVEIGRTTERFFVDRDAPVGSDLEYLVVAVRNDGVQLPGGVPIQVTTPIPPPPSTPAPRPDPTRSDPARPDPTQAAQTPPTPPARPADPPESLRPVTTTTTEPAAPSTAERVRVRPQAQVGTVASSGAPSTSTDDGNLPGATSRLGPQISGRSTTSVGSSAGLASADPASADPASADPASADPASTDPASADPASADPAAGSALEADEAPKRSSDAELAAGPSAEEIAAGPGGGGPSPAKLGDNPVVGAAEGAELGGAPWPLAASLIVAQLAALAMAVKWVIGRR